MASSSYIVCAFVAISLVALLQEGESLRCWVCSSDYDHTCGDPFNTTLKRLLLTDCDRDRSHTPFLQGAPVCRKVNQKVNDQHVVVRSCAWTSDKEEEGPCSPSQIARSVQIEHCSYCYTDECNGASTALLTAFAIPLALLAAYKLR